MAEGFAKNLGGVEAYSSGSKPSGTVNEKATSMMQEAGIDLSTHTSKPLTDLPQVIWDAIVTMGCGDACPHLPAKKRLNWDLQDPKLMPPQGFRSVRDEIKRKVSDLIKDLKNNL